MEKPAITARDLHPLLAQRWSPRAFSEASVSETQLRSLLEAARWAPSCFNEQPWRFLVARRESAPEFERMLSCLNEKNQLWASAGAVLVITAVAKTFSQTGAENRHARHDLGLAVAQLTTQATALGLGVHQMAGFSPDKARDLYAIPAGFEAVTALVIGHPGNAKDLPEPLRQRELAARERKPQDELAFAGTWGAPL
jgi:nitroreductase